MQNQTRMQSVAGAFVVSAPLPDGTWIATFPHFIGRGPDEGAAIAALAAEIANAAREVSLLVPNEIGAYAGTATIERVAGGESFEQLEQKTQLSLVWARSHDGARRFFGAHVTAKVLVLKEAPETEEEIRRYARDAKLFGVDCPAKTSPVYPRSTAGVRRYIASPGNVRYVNEIVELTCDCELGEHGERASVRHIDGDKMTLEFDTNAGTRTVSTGTDYRFLRRVV